MTQRVVRGDPKTRELPASTASAERLRSSYAALEVR